MSKLGRHSHFLVFSLPNLFVLLLTVLNNLISRRKDLNTDMQGLEMEKAMRKVLVYMWQCLN